MPTKPMDRLTANLVDYLTTKLVDCLTAKLVDHLTTKLMLVNQVNFKKIKLKILGLFSIIHVAMATIKILLLT